ncbi:hypothetical protein AJ78_04426 [Emergomyces pasteurianus Ep9510]|uniref:Rab-GAP TBC domain-containing protein n=1 Tax=Emergomyces pasteurianus Ep9510 TaxID=1447872 RepID=A0A1J9QJC6_9EURO|nr:hypothetical protein AJ78_04426 [Emergomyces pasteurianus Ep9510]
MAEALDSRYDAQRRSSSQTSASSRRSHRSKPTRAMAIKRLSASSSTNTPTDLTSFPSLSPDTSPEGFRGEPALNHALSQALLAEDHTRRNGDRGRKATLEGLTTSLPQISGRNALFNDSVASRDVPGSLHLANDDHIERIVARTGAVKLVRQFARDLALRDAEISSIRLRADEREKELKKMLREAKVSNQTIEHRLYILENPIGKSINDSTESLGPLSGARKVSPTIDDMMSQAMSDDVGARVLNSSPEEYGKGGDGDLRDTIRPSRKDSDPRSRGSSVGSTTKKASSGTLLRGWQGYIWGSATASRRTSKASSIMSGLDEQDDGDDFLQMPNPPGNRRKPLDRQLFQPLDANSPTFGPDGKRPTDPKNGDAASVNSRRSSRSFASWTVKLFAGNPQAGQEGTGSAGANSRTPSDPPNSRVRQSSATESLKPSGSAVAALKRLNGTASGQPGSAKSSTASSVRGSKINLSAARRDGLSGTRQGATPESRTTDDNPNALGPVEMDPILPMGSLPPTLTHVYRGYQPGELLTDRFGFIYDQRRKKRQRGADASNNDSSRISVAETISSIRSDPDLSLNTGVDVKGIESPSIATPVDEIENGTIPARRWQDYLKIATKPTELLSHTPAADPIVTVSNAAERKPRSPTVAVQRSGSISVVNSTPPVAAAALMSQVVSNNAEFAGAGNEASATLVPASEQEPVKLLLERLTELHDSLQRDRTIKWNEFLRKVRAERRKEGEASDRPSVSLAMPEASLADGEVVGITGLGTKGKVGRAKWREFRSLVIGGIPVAYRAKIWSECSGASAMRVPGYYDDLVKGNMNPDADPSVVAQIEMDIHRTLTDNVFFRKGPGVQKLNEVLLAYSRRNPDVGYCQGMNLIAGSLLLIMPTAEDAFWILASLIENILPAHYYDHGLLASRADQQVLRQYVSEILPRLSAHLDELGIELEALAFQWFLSAFTDCLSAEALYRVWDVVFCLNTPTASATTAALTPQVQSQAHAQTENTNGTTVTPTGPNFPNPANTLIGSTLNSDGDVLASSGGGGSTFFFQVAVALLKLNEQQLLTTCSTPAAVYTYINHQMTNHAISIDGLIQASEALRNVIKREDVCARRVVALRDMRADMSGGGYAGSVKTDGSSVGGADKQ